MASNDDDLGADLEKMREDAALSDHKLWAAIKVLVEILESAGITNEGHRRLIDRIKRSSKPPRRVRLAIFEDKYKVPNADVDCAARMHLCHARCCSMRIDLSRRDVEEGELQWQIDHPYVIRRGDDGYCHYLDRETNGCTTYHNRPAVCRKYECSDDPRVWKDFEAMIPADMPHEVLTSWDEPE